MIQYRKWLIIFFAFCIIYLISFTILNQGVYAAPTPPQMIIPVDYAIIPHYITYLKWEDVTNESRYLISVRDMTTNTLIRNRISIAQNAVFYSIPTIDLIKGHQYSWALASVDSAGVEFWAPATRIFTVEPANPDSHVWSDDYANASHLDFWVNDGGNATYGNNILQAGVEMWNNVSTKVSVHRDLNTTVYEVGIISSSHTDPNYFGYTVNYNGSTKIGGSDVTSAWTWTEIYIYTNNTSPKPDWFEKANVAHEIGHALSLGHTANVWTVELMDQGDETNLPAGTTDNDRTHLRLKWGW